MLRFARIPSVSTSWPPTSREKDLNNLTTFLDGLSTQSALLAGFAFVGFAELPSYTPLALQYLLYIATAITLGSNLFVVCVGQLATILGPTLALNGPVGSMEKAVTAMRKQRKFVFIMFVIGLGAFFFMVEVLIILYNFNHPGIASVSAVIVFAFFVLTAISCMRMMGEFHFKAPQLGYLVKGGNAKEMENEFAKKGAEGGVGGKVPATQFLAEAGAASEAKM